MRILLVEDDAADLSFLREALDEAASLRRWPGHSSVEIICASFLDEACDTALDWAFDVLLLNLSLPDSPALHETFRNVQSVARSIPILVLADEDDARLAANLLREGAQDVLLKASLDAAPLAIAIGNAIERQRHVNSLSLAADKAIALAPLPPVAPESGTEDNVLLSLLRVTGVSTAAADIETVMLSD
jgi:DNA-binding NarL/FixJ family response regulator